MKKKYVYFFVFLFLHFSPLKAANKNTNFDYTKILYYSKIDEKGDSNKIIQKDQLKANKPSNDKEINRLNDLIIQKEVVGQLDQELFDLCDKLIKAIGRSEKHAPFLYRAFRDKAIILSLSNGSYEEILNNFNKASEICKKANLIKLLSANHMYIANYMQDIRDYKLALKECELGIKYLKDSGEGINAIPDYELRKAEILLKLYNEDAQKKDVDAAILIIDNQIAKGKAPETSDAFALKAYVSLIKNEYENTLTYIDSSFSNPYYSIAKNVFITDNFRNGLKAIAYFKKEQLQKGNFFLKKTNIENPDHLLSEILYKELYLNEKKEGRFENALLFYEKSIALEKEKYFYKNKIQIREFTEKNKVNQKNLQLSELKSNKKSLIMYLLIALVLLLTIGLLSFYLFLKKKREIQKVEFEIKKFTENEMHKISFAKVEAVNEMRKSFSMQLHNEIGTIILATSNFLKTKKKLEKIDEHQSHWQDIIEELQKVYAVVRNESHQIYDSSRSNELFFTDLEKNIQLIFSGKNINLKTIIEVTNEQNISPDIKLCILSIIKEGSTNIVKYSNAKNVSISVVTNDNIICIDINNDNSLKPFLKNNLKFGFGLSSLKSSIEKLNGQFFVNQGEKKFEISAIIPLHNKIF